MSSQSPRTVCSYRDEFKSVAKQLLQSLETSSGQYVHDAQLPHDLLHITQFDPEDDEAVNSYPWLFIPLSVEKLTRYPLDHKGLQPGEEKIPFHEFVPVAEPTTLQEKMSQEPDTRTQILLHCFEALFLHQIRKKIRKPLSKMSKWQPIGSENPFLSTQGLLLDPRCCGWDSMVFEREPLPHIMILAIQRVTVTKDEMIVGELGPIVQAISNRLEQKEFAQTAFFPILLISLCGPQHGRIIQGCFDRSGKLEVRMSKLYSFMTLNEAPFDLFLRFLANEPQLVPFDPDNEA